MSGNWYLINIEEPIRDLVRRLRNEGVNTNCSCGHEMWIGFDSNDPSADLRNIKTVLLELKLHNWKVTIEEFDVGGQIFYARGMLRLEETIKNES